MPYLQSVSSPYRPSPLGYGSPPSRNSPFRQPVSRLAFAAATRDAHRIADQARGLEIREAQHPDDHARELDAQGTGALRNHGLAAAAAGPAVEEADVQAAGQRQRALTPTARPGQDPARRVPDPRPRLRRRHQPRRRGRHAWPAGYVLTAHTHAPANQRLRRTGLPNGTPEVSKFFPPSRPQTIALAAFLNSLAEALAALSPSGELLSAFSAFDDDSGQVDWAELRDALLNTAPEPGERALAAAEVDKVVDGFTGRRAFNRSMNAQLGSKRGDVFKYHDFVISFMGSNGGSEGGSQENSED